MTSILIQSGTKVGHESRVHCRILGSTLRFWAVVHLGPALVLMKSISIKFGLSGQFFENGPSHEPGKMEFKISH